MRPATGPGPGNDVGDTVPRHVTNRDFDAASERGLVRVEARDLRDVLEAVTSDFDHAHEHAAAAEHAGDDVGQSVLIDVAAGDGDAPWEVLVVGIETGEVLARVPD